ncbi:FAD-dependent monooxygenase [Allokutzneria sp. A3M-2-11 16]|uniref:FAD-dependent oxidoreductase n=1 Tax=Allokutzneria sp. A3M-2-11 16 TaxID=2962043 RepID=UPI0020B872AA|nr:FAD-dependent monooxygenase [Allokutzneria sp. A3M-2-11 16]MCP3803469.1 FAD-dependent monooxygenase [Allokutzneria sp. A3M-2-11 16]
MRRGATVLPPRSRCGGPGVGERDGKPVLLNASRGHGLHSWPRGNLMLIAQPNVDATYTTSLWLPFAAEDPARPSWATMRTPQDVRRLFSEHFPDTRQFLPSFAEDVLSAHPGALKTVRCSPYHHERTVLLGDAAHTLVPFFGQGINYSFEDVRCFFEILDRNLAEVDVDTALRGTLPEFTRLRKPAGDAITDLSLAMGAQLKRHSATAGFQARAVLERRLHERHPDLYIPL